MCSGNTQVSPYKRRRFLDSLRMRGRASDGDKNHLRKKKLKGDSTNFAAPPSHELIVTVASPLSDWGSQKNVCFCFFFGRGGFIPVQQWLSSPADYEALSGWLSQSRGLSLAYVSQWRDKMANYWLELMLELSSCLSESGFCVFWRRQAPPIWINFIFKSLFGWTCMLTWFVSVKLCES